MDKKYFKVLAKCGHVGRNNYIEKWFYIKAENGKEAAKIVRNMPRVKHHHKDAIREVKQIKCEEFLYGKKIMSEDKYFKAHSSQEQKLFNCIKQEDIYPEKREIRRRKTKNEKPWKRIKYEAIERKQKKLAQRGEYDG